MTRYTSFGFHFSETRSPSHWKSKHVTLRGEQRELMLTTTLSGLSQRSRAVDQLTETTTSEGKCSQACYLLCFLYTRSGDMFVELIPDLERRQ